MGRKNKAIVWHYTYSSIKAILQSRVLLPSGMVPQYQENLDLNLTLLHPEVKLHEEAFAGLAADAKLLLFSQREYWEPASWKAYMRPDGETVELHKLEDYEKNGLPVFRIGVSRSLLHPYIRLIEMVKMPKWMAANLEKIARERGSNPYDWWGTTKPIPCDKWEDIQVYDAATKTWKSLLEEESEALPMAAD